MTIAPAPTPPYSDNIVDKLLIMSTTAATTINYFAANMENHLLTNPNVSDITIAQDHLGNKLAKFVYHNSNSGMSFVIDTDKMLYSQLNILFGNPLNQIPFPTKPTLDAGAKNIKMWMVENKEYKAYQHTNTQCIKYFEALFGPTMASAKLSVTTYLPGCTALQAIDHLTDELPDSLAKTAAASKYMQ